MLFLVNSLVTFIANLMLGLFVYLRNPNSLLNRLFLGMAISIALWIATLYLYYTIDDPNWVLWIGRINFSAPTLGIYFMYRFVSEFPKSIIKLPIWFEWILLILSWSLALMAGFTPLVDKSETIIGIERKMEFGPLYGIWLASILLTLFLSFYIIWRKIRLARGLEKSQLWYVGVAFISSFGFGITTNTLLPFLFGIHTLEPLGPLGALLLTGITAYAIVKHRFLDITAIVARAVTYTLTLLAIVGLEAGLVAIGVRFLPAGVDRVMVAAAGAIVIVMGYDALRGTLSKFTEKIFFQGRYDTEKVLAKLTHTMASEIEIKKLSQKLLQIIVGETKVMQGAFVLVTDHKVSQVEAVNWVGESDLHTGKWDELLHRGRAQYVFEDLEDGETKEMFRQKGITVAMPLIVKDGEIGFLILGPKASGDVYAERDLALLSIFAPQAAVAMNNARAYQEIQKFSKTLEKKVEERTTELKKVQQEQLLKASELLRIKDEFVFIATHDLATPVTAIAGFVELIKTSKEKIPADIKEDLSAIDEATDRLRALVNDLLEVARGESGTIRVSLQSVNIVKTVEEAIQLLRQRAKKRQIKFDLRLDKENNWVLADQAKLSEVVENLLSNAVKYNKDGGEIVVSSQKAGDRLVLQISDTGIGIPEKEQSKVFTKFFRSESDETRKQTGTGLGLFVVKMLMDKMKGKISFVSKEGEGTKFRLDFRLAKKADND